MKIDPTKPDIDYAFIQSVIRDPETLKRERDDLAMPGFCLVTNLWKYFPSFQYETFEPFKLYSMFVRYTTVLNAYSDPIRFLKWWLTENSTLAAAPAALLGTPRELEIVKVAEEHKSALAAERLRRGNYHG